VVVGVRHRQISEGGFLDAFLDAVGLQVSFSQLLALRADVGLRTKMHRAGQPIIFADISLVSRGRRIGFKRRGAADKSGQRNNDTTESYSWYGHARPPVTPRKFHISGEPATDGKGFDATIQSNQAKRRDKPEYRPPKGQTWSTHPANRYQNPLGRCHRATLVHFLLACRNWPTIVPMHALDSERETAREASNMIGKVKIKFKVNVIENACLVARARHLMTHGKFAEGYNLIKDMQGGDFLTALRMLVEQESLVTRISDFRERHKTKGSESIAALLTRAAEGGDEEAMSLLAAGALERQV